MTKELRDFMVEKTNELMAAFSCSSETKAAAQGWLDALDTDQEESVTKQYITELEADIVPIDNLIAFAGSEHGSKVFGPEKAKEVAAHASEIKEKGAVYCDCPACNAALKILERKSEI